LITALSFASCYLYAPGGADEISQRSRLLCSLLKAGDRRLIVNYARQVKCRLSDHPSFAKFLDSGGILVPVPGSDALNCGSPSVSCLLAEAFVCAGLARARRDCLRRVRVIRKSATAPPNERPTAQMHYDSLCVDRRFDADECASLTLIDDVVTRGRTLLAAATRLREAFPRTPVRAFALVRTMGFAAHLDCLFDPCVGEIRWRRGDARRNP
jgi:hypothetical protein